ncbi:MAG: TlyA family RNA methyltransferase [Lachnospiraceae bacterium]|nr:TlyA family RNA methyltransferase [Lachnospiraceae bacterium]
MKERLDVLVVQRGLAPSREKAKALIMAGVVLVNDQREDKAGSTFPVDAEIRIKGTPQKYVSRGGYKLEKAMQVWPIDLTDKICMDVGASTGGFTDCMLQNGAAKVYAVDVGTNQLAWSLRNDPRVICMEKTNVRYLTPEQIADEIAFVSIDVSFISLTKVLPAIWEVMAEGAQMAALVKPQFEAGREKVGKKGVVRDAKVHETVLEDVSTFVLANGFEILGMDHSPIRGPEGNIEYLLYLQKRSKELTDDPGSWEPVIKELVARSHATL